MRNRKTYSLPSLLVLGVMAVALTSCASLGIFKYDDNPVVQATVSANANRASITAAGGEPESVFKVPHLNLDCYNYTLQSGANRSPFYVLFNERDEIAAYGYLTCAQAQAQGALTSSEKMRQRF